MGCKYRNFISAVLFYEIKTHECLTKQDKCLFYFDFFIYSLCFPFWCYVSGLLVGDKSNCGNLLLKFIY